MQTPEEQQLRLVIITPFGVLSEIGNWPIYGLSKDAIITQLFISVSTVSSRSREVRVPHFRVIPISAIAQHYNIISGGLFQFQSGACVALSLLYTYRPEF